MNDLFTFLHQFVIDGVHLDIVAGWIVTVILAAKAFCAATPTPDPIKYPIYAKFYKVIEYAAIIVGFVKHNPSATQTKIIKDVATVGSDINSVKSA